MLISCGVRLRIWVDMGRYFLSCCAALWLADLFLNLQFVHDICYDGRIYADFYLKSLVETEK